MHPALLLKRRFNAKSLHAASTRQSRLAPAPQQVRVCLRDEIARGAVGFSLERVERKGKIAERLARGAIADVTAPMRRRRAVRRA
jgi:hypothetical protein